MEVNGLASSLPLRREFRQLSCVCVSIDSFLFSIKSHSSSNLKIIGSDQKQHLLPLWLLGCKVRAFFFLLFFSQLTRGAWWVESLERCDNTTTIWWEPEQSQFLSVTTDKTQMQTDQKGHTKEGALNMWSQHHRINSICGCLADSWEKKKTLRRQYQEVRELDERQLALLPVCTAVSFVGNQPATAGIWADNWYSQVGVRCCFYALSY